MTPEKQRIAIALACGWKWWRFSEPGGYFTDLLSPDSGNWAESKRFQGRLVEGPMEGEDPDLTGLPDYLHDLNAMHKVEKMLLTEIHETRYLNFLASTFPVKDISQLPISTITLVRATAAQRAEAFLRTINKWEESA